MLLSAPLSPYKWYFYHPLPSPSRGSGGKKACPGGHIQSTFAPFPFPLRGKARKEFRENTPSGYFCPPAQCPAPALQTCPPRAYLARAVHPRYNRIFAPQIALFASVLPPTCLRHASDMPPTAFNFPPRFREETAGTSPQPPRTAPRTPPGMKKAPHMRGYNRGIYECYNCIDWRVYSSQNFSSSFISFIASSSSLLT